MDKLPLTSRKWTPEQAREFFKKKEVSRKTTSSTTIHSI